jgi:hypothetical protein
VKTYLLETSLPAWHFDQATSRQLKLLRFFDIDTSNPLTKGTASGIIGRLLSVPANEHLWGAYVYTTGDEERLSTELRPHDRASLSRTIIPADWRPKRRSGSTPGSPSTTQKALEELVATEFREGSPFDDPAPKVSIAGSVFSFTGLFDFGSRRECREAVVSRGGHFTDNVTTKTDVLVIGSDASPAWANEGYGNKIEVAMVFRHRRGRPRIISEAYWKKLLEA